MQSPSSEPVAPTMMAPPSPSRPLVTLLSDALLAASIAAAWRTISAPWTSLLQLARGGGGGGGGRPPANIPELLRQVRAQPGGLLSLWRGNAVQCLRYAPMEGTVLATNDFLLRQCALTFSSSPNDTPFALPLSQGVKFASGGLAGALAHTMSYPYDKARVGVMTNKIRGTGPTGGPVEWIQVTARTQGLAGLYAGWTTSVMSTVVYRAIQLGCFEQIQEDMNPYRSDTGFRGLLSTYLAAATGRSLATPFNHALDTITRRLTLQSDKPPEKRPYKGIVHCLVQICRQEGLRSGLLRGMTPQGMVSAGLLSGASVVIVAYDRIKVVCDL